MNDIQAAILGRLSHSPCPHTILHSDVENALNTNISLTVFRSNTRKLVSKGLVERPEIGQEDYRLTADGQTIISLKPDDIQTTIPCQTNSKSPSSDD